MKKTTAYFLLALFVCASPGFAFEVDVSYQSMARAVGDILLEDLIVGDRANFVDPEFICEKDNNLYLPGQTVIDTAKEIGYYKFQARVLPGKNVELTLIFSEDITQKEAYKFIIYQISKCLDVQYLNLRSPKAKVTNLYKVVSIDGKKSLSEMIEHYKNMD